MLQTKLSLIRELRNLSLVCEGVNLEEVLFYEKLEVIVDEAWSIPFCPSLSWSSALGVVKLVIENRANSGSITDLPFFN